MATPTFVSAGSLGAGTGTVTPGAPASRQAGDILILLVESANQSVATPSGWTVIANNGTGTAGNITATAISSFWLLDTTGSAAMPTLADSGEHTIAVCLAFRNVDQTTPINTSATSVAASAATSVTIPAVTPTVAGCLIVGAVTNSSDTATSQGSGYANAGLSSITEIFDGNSTQGGGGGISVFSGVRAAASSTGTTSATLATSSIQARLTLALRPGPILLATPFTDTSTSFLSVPKLTFSPTDKHSALTLSNSDQTVTYTASGSGVPRGLRLSIPLTGVGKRYFEFNLTTLANGASIGIADSSWVLTDDMGLNAGSIAYFGNAAFDNLTSYFSTGGPQFASGDVGCIAYDSATNEVWFRVTSAPTVWNGSASNNPATGVGGISCANLAATKYIGLSLYYQNDAASARLNTGDTLTGTAPSGFTLQAWSATAQIVQYPPPTFTVSRPVTCAASSALKRDTGSRRTITVSGAVTRLRAISRTLALTALFSTSSSRALARITAVVVGSVVANVKRATVYRSVTPAAGSSALKSVGRTSALNTTAASALSKTALKSRLISVVTNTTGTAIRGFLLVLSIAASTAVLYKNAIAKITQSSASSATWGYLNRVLSANLAILTLSSVTRKRDAFKQSAITASSVLTRSVLTRRTLAVLTAASVSGVRNLLRAASLSVSAFTVVARGAAVQISANADASTAVNAARSTLKRASVILAGFPARTVGVGRAVAVGTTGITSAVKLSGFHVAVSSFASSTATRRAGKNLQLAVSALIDFRRDVARTCAVSASAVLSLFRSLARGLSVGATSTAVGIKQARLLKLTGVGAATTVIKSTGKRLVASVATGTGVAHSVARRLILTITALTGAAIRKSVAVSRWVTAEGSVAASRMTLKQVWSTSSAVVQQTARRLYIRTLAIYSRGVVQTNKQIRAALLIASLIAVTSKRIHRNKRNGSGALMGI